MQRKRIIGFAGTFDRPSRTFTLVNHIATEAQKRYKLEKAVFNLADLGPSLTTTRKPEGLDATARAVITEIVNADALIIGVPTYNAGYPGMFKHLFDLISPDALERKPVILAATGGTERHSLIIDYQLRPLFSYFRALTLPTAIYAVSSQYRGDHIIESELLQRIDRTVSELQYWLGSEQTQGAEILGRAA